ncbi:hypothetical protein SLEP1_g28301 [Rubroshorea leprosula]|uniref:Putative E3 ubiquitin-protein ligase LIN N-terminal domain-containing protein n=1 Tax=Rubroshorea leprosula TaxID=152421 RepID=A0AAV5K5K3_9ROSI|nr:hypothetical protein SLEP1_g28301 [Rubroshorea leprosula]
MFIIDPFFSRIDFAPELWKDLFLPYMGSIVGWYSESRHRLMMEVIPASSSDLSFAFDFDQFFIESVVFSMRPDQMEKLKVIPILPISEPPMSSLHEVSLSIPDYVKFGPILPKSGEFSPVFRSKRGEREDSRTTLNSAMIEDLDESATWFPQDVPEENEDESDYEPNDAYADVEDRFQEVVYVKVVKQDKDKEIGSAVFSLSSKAARGSFPTGFDIQHITINNDFIFTATRVGIIEVWLKERITRVDSIKIRNGGNAKIIALTSDMDGAMLYAGTSDGKIQVRT